MKQILSLLIALSALHLHAAHPGAATRSILHTDPHYAALSPEERASFEHRVTEIANIPSCHFGIPCSTTTIERFPAALYNNPNFKTLGLRPSKLASFKRRSSAKELTMLPGSPDIKQYNHAYALQQIEATGLLKKPFHEWELSDLRRVNGWLSRQQVALPGKFRTQSLALRIASGLPETTVRDIAQRFARVSQTKKDKELLAKSTYLLSEPNAIEPELTQWFDDTKARLERIQANKVSQIIHFELNVVGHLHFYLHKIHAWKKANTPTACVLGNVILMQHGVKPIIFTDKQAYKAAFHSVLTPEKAKQEVFGNYIKSLILAQQQPKTATPSTSN